jgi:hypothetical protein
MYGIVNKAVEDLVVYHYGLEKWEKIKEKTGIDIDFFISDEPYNDELTYKLVAATAEEMNVHIDEVMQSFGKWWIQKTGIEKYGSLMKTGGASLREFLINLPLFHNRVMLIYPKLTPPEFKVSDIEERSIHVHYFSKRVGLQEFVRGLLLGLGYAFKEDDIQVEMLQSINKGFDHDVFKVIW